jgi:hypothetical protein
MNIMNQINFKYIAIGILIGYLSPYVIALISSYFSPQISLKDPLAHYGN